MSEVFLIFDIHVYLTELLAICMQKMSLKQGWKLALTHPTIDCTHQTGVKRIKENGGGEQL